MTAKRLKKLQPSSADRGFRSRMVGQRIEGLDKARSSRPDAMIVDRLLPGMDGLTVIEALRKERQVRTPVLVLSALGAVDDRVRGLRMGWRRLSHPSHSRSSNSSPE